MRGLFDVKTRLEYIETGLKSELDWITEHKE